MPNIALRDIKTAFYHFLDRHGARLNLVNFQFNYETGADLNRGLTWFKRNEKIEEARFFAEEGTYIDYFDFCVRENYYSLQMGDGSLLQIDLRTDGQGKLEGGSLAFIPRPGNGFDYLRFDNEPTQARHYRHNRYHVHFGFHAKNMRISALQFPWPSEFIAFVAHLMSDKKGRTVEGGHFHADVEITAFHHDHLLRNLSACGESFNHSFSFCCAENGGTRSQNLKSASWKEEIS
jgi:hypothetical protein